MSSYSFKTSDEAAPWTLPKRHMKTDRNNFAVKICNVYEIWTKIYERNKIYVVAVVQTLSQMISAIFAGDPIITSRVLMCDNRYQNL